MNKTRPDPKVRAGTFPKRGQTKSGFFWSIGWKESVINHSFSIPTFLTLAFFILSGNQAGPLAGLSTISIQPVNT